MGFAKNITNNVIGTTKLKHNNNKKSKHKNIAGTGN